MSPWNRSGSPFLRVAGRPLNTPPRVLYSTGEAGTDFAPKRSTKRPTERIVQQTDWPRCTHFMQEWPPCRGDTWCCVVETLLADSAYGR